MMRHVFALALLAAPAAAQETSPLPELDASLIVSTECPPGANLEYVHRFGMNPQTGEAWVMLALPDGSVCGSLMVHSPQIDNLRAEVAALTAQVEALSDDVTAQAAMVAERDAALDAIRAALATLEPAAISVGAD